MKTFKQYDVLVSILLILGFIVASLIKKDERFIYGYFITGGCQIISMLAHAINGWFTEKGGVRRTYHWIVAIIISMGVLTPLVQVFFFIYYILLFAAPFMAIAYSWICYNELKKINSRPLDLF